MVLTVHIEMYAYVEHPCRLIQSYWSSWKWFLLLPFHALYWEVMQYLLTAVILTFSAYYSPWWLEEKPCLLPAVQGTCIWKLCWRPLALCVKREPVPLVQIYPSLLKLITFPGKKIVKQNLQSSACITICISALRGRRTVSSEGLTPPHCRNNIPNCFSLSVC